MTKEFKIVLLDMDAIVYMIPLTYAATFKEYATIHMASYVKGVPQLSTTHTYGICLGEYVYRDLPLFHALSSCDTIFQLFGIG